MATTTQFAVEVHYVSLPASEIEERRGRFRALLLRGAIRLVRQQAAEREAAEVAPIGSGRNEDQ
jgi:hypothetical protein